MKSSLRLSRAFYFFYYAAAASLWPFMALFYDRLGFTGTQIGVLRGISPIVMLISAPLWGALSDSTQQHKRILLIAIGGTLLMVASLSLATGYIWLMVIAILYAFFGAPIIALMDNTVLHLLQGEKQKYGRQRIWGAVGWGLASPLIGLLSERLGQQWIFYGYLLMMTCALFVASRMFISQQSIRPQFWHDIGTLLTNKQWIVFLVSILFGSMPLSIANTFLFLYLKDMGASEILMGLSLTAATLSELPMWFFSDSLLRRWRPRGMLMFSILACALQAFGYSLATVPLVIMAFQLIHGPAFSVMWSAGVAYAADISTESTRATAQGMFGGVTMGLRSALGTLIGGVLYDRVGGAMTFRIGGLISIIGLIIFIVNLRDQRKIVPNSC